MVSLLTAVLPSFFDFLNHLPSILEVWGPRKTLIFIEIVIIFEVFRILHLNVIWGVFGWPLGPSWGSLGTLLAAFLVVLGPLGELLGSLWGFHDDFSGDKAPKMSPRRPKEPPEASKRPPKGLQKTPQTPPRDLPEALKIFQEAFQRTPQREKDNNIYII